MGCAACAPLPQPACDTLLCPEGGQHLAKLHAWLHRWLAKVQQLPAVPLGAQLQTSIGRGNDRLGGPCGAGPHKKWSLMTSE